jgi:ribose transport system permease protein
MRRFHYAAYSRELALAAIIVLVILLFSLLYPYSFRSWDNFNAILRNLAFEGILSLGMMLLLIGGTFDLSVGAMASMTGVIAGWLMKEAGWPVPAAVLAALAVATAGGAANGVFVAKFRVNALITTLGTMGIFQGVALLIGGPGITFLPDSFSRFGQAERLGVQAPVWLLAFMAVGAHVLLTHSRFFRQYYYIGSNAKAAQLSGIRVDRLRILSFALMGLIAGIAGVVYAARIATATALVGAGAELQAIAAVILGGASLSGGKGTIWGAMLGVFFMALVKNVLIISRVSSEWQGIVLGAVLVTAVAVDSLMTRKQD